jgi:hypothetical protein
VSIFNFSVLLDIYCILICKWLYDAARSERYNHNVGEDDTEDEPEDALFHSFSSCSPRYSREQFRFDKSNEVWMSLFLESNVTWIQFLSPTYWYRLVLLTYSFLGRECYLHCAQGFSTETWYMLILCCISNVSSWLLNWTAFDSCVSLLHSMSYFPIIVLHVLNAVV